MANTALGHLISHLHAARGLTFRELGQLSELDHAYIHRLESGSKESPSPDTVTKLIRGLKPSARDADMLRFLAEHGDTPVGLVEATLADSAVNFRVFAAAAGASFRGRPQDYKTLLARVARFVAEDDAGG